VTGTRVRRNFIATPARPAAATWAAIVAVVAPEGAPGRGELEAAAGVAASLIAAEAWRRTAAVLSGVGPQLRIYCLYGEDAIVADDANEDALSWSPTDGDWSLSLPCPPEDLDWVTAALAQVSSRITAFDATDTRTAERASAGTPRPEIDAGEFLAS
jgi:hypothetical protein